MPSDPDYGRVTHGRVREQEIVDLPADPGRDVLPSGHLRGPVQ